MYACTAYMYKITCIKNFGYVCHTEQNIQNFVKNLQLFAKSVLLKFSSDVNQICIYTIMTVMIRDPHQQSLKQDIRKKFKLDEISEKNEAIVWQLMSGILGGLLFLIFLLHIRHLLKHKKKKRKQNLEKKYVLEENYKHSIN